MLAGSLKIPCIPWLCSLADRECRWPKNKRPDGTWKLFVLTAWEVLIWAPFWLRLLRFGRWRRLSGRGGQLNNNVQGRKAEHEYHYKPPHHRLLWCTRRMAKGRGAALTQINVSGFETSTSNSKHHVDIG
jgi:hypothetical protein